MNLQALFTYDDIAGVLRYATDRGGMKTGDPAGYTDAYGYRRVYISGKNYAEHRLIWEFVYGLPPTKQLDHIDGDKQNNRISNLREVTPTENSQNRRQARIDSTSGVIGVGLHQGKWRARIRVDKKRIELGSFDSLEDASAAYQNAKKKFHISQS
jgi:hypothetical protein